MHTMVVRMSIDPERADEAARHLREDVVAWARQQPGFVNGQWLRSPDGSEGIGVVVFASPDAAASAARGPRSYPRDDEPGLERRERHRLRAAHIGLVLSKQAVHEFADRSDHVEPVAVGEPVAVPVVQVVGGVIAVEVHHDRRAAFAERSGAQPDRVDRAEPGVGDQDDDIGGDEVTQRHRVAVGC